MPVRSFFFLAIMLFSLRTAAQSASRTDALPTVFLIGEYEDQYLDLARRYPAVFVAMFDNDLDAAFKTWSEFLMDMEDTAGQLNFDLRGIKLWLNLYFAPDGRIGHIAFYPKPNSRLVPEEHLVAFFRQFAARHQIPVTWEKGFQHSASVSFPTHFARSGSETVRRD